MRARQLWNWIYVHGGAGFRVHDESGQGFPKAHDGALHAGRGRKSSPSKSPRTATCKFLLRTGPGIEFETVYIPEEDRGTPLRFLSGRLHASIAASCHTGTQKLVRNLTPL